jgi:hypothetical protein
MLPLLKRNNGLTILLTIVIIGFNWFLKVKTGQNIYEGEVNAPIYNLVLNLPLNAIIYSFVSLIFFIILSLLIIQFNNQFYLVSEYTFLPALIYVLLVGPLFPVQILGNVFLAATLIMVSLIQISRTFKSKGIAYQYFNAAFLIALAGFFYFGAVYYIVILFIAQLLLRGFRWREWVLIIFGSITPFLFYFSLAYIFSFEWRGFFTNVPAYIDYTEVIQLRSNKIYVLFIVLMIFLSSINIIREIQKKKIYLRRIFQTLFWLFLVSISIALALINSYPVENLIIGLIPVTYIICHFFYFSRSKRIGGLLFLILLLGSIALRIFHFYGY